MMTARGKKAQEKDKIITLLNYKVVKVKFHTGGNLMLHNSI